MKWPISEEKTKSSLGTDIAVGIIRCFLRGNFFASLSLQYLCLKKGFKKYLWFCRPKKSWSGAIEVPALGSLTPACTETARGQRTGGK